MACDKHKFNILVFLKNKFSCDFSKLDNLLNLNVLSYYEIFKEINQFWKNL